MLKIQVSQKINEMHFKTVTWLDDCLVCSIDNLMKPTMIKSATTVVGYLLWVVVNS